MQRYFVESSAKDHVVLSKEQCHHILKVLRMRVGDQFYVVLSNQQSGIVEITTIFEQQVDVKWVRDETIHKELPVDVTIACGLSKGDKIEWIVQKATELGMANFIPLTTDWSVVKWETKKESKKIERLQKIALEAAEQSHRTRLPKCQNLMSISQLCQQVKQYDHVIVAYEEDAKQQEHYQFKSLLKTMAKGQSILVVFGSEGGLSPKEIDLLKQSNAKTCGLGPRIMRAETAPLYVLSAISYELEL